MVDIKIIFKNGGVVLEPEGVLVDKLPGLKTINLGLKTTAKAHVQALIDAERARGSRRNFVTPKGYGDYEAVYETRDGSLQEPIFKGAPVVTPQVSTAILKMLVESTTEAAPAG
jgi:hypothetical protein